MGASREMTREELVSERVDMRAELQCMDSSLDDRKCPQCGSLFVTELIETERFQYGANKDAPWLEVEVPVYSCNNACNGTHGESPFQWMDWKAEALKHAKVVETLLRGALEAAKCEAGDEATDLDDYRAFVAESPSWREFWRTREEARAEAEQPSEKGGERG